VLPQLGQGVTKDLAYTPLGQLQGFADLFEGNTLVEIKSRDEPFPILEPTYGVDELGAQIHWVGVGLSIATAATSSMSAPYSIPRLSSTSKHARSYPGR
jgi:hypothetical protein